MSKKPQQQQIIVKQVGGCQNGCLMGLGLIAAIVFVIFILPAGCTMLIGKAAYDGIKAQESKPALSQPPLTIPTPVEDVIPWE